MPDPSLRPATIAVTSGRPDHVPDAPLNHPITMAATYVAGFGAIAASFRAPQFGRAVGAAVFASALLLFLWFARGTIRSYRAPDSSLLVAAAAPALLGLIAWLIGARRAGRHGGGLPAAR